MEGEVPMLPPASVIPPPAREKPVARVRQVVHAKRAVRIRPFTRVQHQEPKAAAETGFGRPLWVPEAAN